MFVEEKFDEDEDVTVSDGEKPSRQPTRRSQPMGPATQTMFFHRPGEDGFCAVAGAGDDTDALLDARTISGDSWVNSECHCLRCECLRVMQKLERVQQRAAQANPTGSAAPLVLLFLDLDNFGFNQFKSVPPGASLAAVDDDDEGGGDGPSAARHPDAPVHPLKHLFVWAFFGSCFTRYHGKWPTEETVCEALPSTKPAGNDGEVAQAVPRRPSIWQRLVKAGRVHFTPCAGQSQAADGVIMAALGVFAERDVVLLTGDSKLLAEVYSRRRMAGRKSRRDNEHDIMSDRLTLIDINDCGKRFVPVWRQLEQRVTQIVRNVWSRSMEADDDDVKGD